MTRKSTRVSILIGLRALTFDCIVRYFFLFILLCFSFDFLTMDRHFSIYMYFSLFLCIAFAHAQAKYIWLLAITIRKVCLIHTYIIYIYGSMGHYINLDKNYFGIYFFLFTVISVSLIIGLFQTTYHYFQMCKSNQVNSDSIITNRLELDVFFFYLFMILFCFLPLLLWLVCVCVCVC